MSKKIVVITGSPRKNGNSFAMTDALKRRKRKDTRLQDSMQP